MAQRRTSVKKIREALRLHQECGLSLRQTAQALSISRPVVTGYLDRCQARGINWDKAQTMTDEELSGLFAGEQPDDPKIAVLREHFPRYEKDLLRVGVTRQILWEEYRDKDPEGYSYSQFCYHFQQWKNEQELYMRIEHKAGDKLYVDYAGKKMEIVDIQTGEIRPVELFIAALGASKLIYARAVMTQQKHDFIGAQVSALQYIGGVPKAIVPDCLKSAITKGHRYEPDINPEYQDFASHYGTTILAARPYKPRDKAMVEGAVRIVYQRIYAPLRDRVFHSLEELNRAIDEKLDELNKRPMKQYAMSRWELFRETEKDALMALPVDEYVIRHYARCKVQFNYHIYLKDDRHYYSVPYQHRGKQVDVRYTATGVEIYLNNARIALHRRCPGKFGYSTVKEHMPPGHRFMDDWSAEKFITWAGNIGPQVKAVIEGILNAPDHPEKGYKTCLGILNLAREYGQDRLDKACARALFFDRLSYKMISTMLKNGLENVNDESPSDTQLEMFDHANIRGPEYYH
jgi:transposase